MPYKINNKSDKKDFLLIPLIHFVSPFKRLQRLLKSVSSCTCGNVHLITFAEQSCHTDSVAVPFVIDYIGRLLLEVGFKLERNCE